MQLTINGALELVSEVNRRLSDLRSIRGSLVTSRKETYGIGENQRTTETENQYDAKVVDLKITNLETWLFKVKSAIKQANATTSITVDGNVDVLLAPLS